MKFQIYAVKKPQSQDSSCDLSGDLSGHLFSVTD